jgi:hypothetical protein
LVVGSLTGLCMDAVTIAQHLDARYSNLGQHFSAATRTSITSWICAKAKWGI